MIRKKLHADAAEAELDLLRQLVASYASQVQQNDPYRVGQSYSLVRLVSLLEAELATYFHCSSESNAPHVIAGIDSARNTLTIPDALNAMRKASRLRQKELAARLRTKQSTVARHEHPLTSNPRLNTLTSWATECGYDLLPLFVRRGGHGCPAAFARLAVLLATLKSQVNSFTPASTRYCISQFVRLVIALLEADCSTLYLLDRSSNRLCLVAHAGILHPQDLGGELTRDELPMKLLSRAQPGFLAGTDPVLEPSEFGKREGVRSVLYVPFAERALTGIVFINYRRDVSEPSSEYVTAARALGPQLSLLLTGAPVDALFDSTPGNGPRIPSVLRSKLRQLVAVDSQSFSWEPFLGAVGQHIALGHALYHLYARDETGDQLRLTRHLCGDQIGDTGLEDTLRDLAQKISESGLTVREERLDVSGRPTAILGVPLLDNDRRARGALLLASSEPRSVVDHHRVLLRGAAYLAMSAMRCREFLQVPRRWGASSSVTKWHKLLKLLEPSRRTAAKKVLTALCEVVLEETSGLVVSVWRYDRGAKRFPVDQGAFACAQTKLAAGTRPVETGSEGVMSRRVPELKDVKPRDRLGASAAIVHSTNASLRYCVAPEKNEELNRAIAVFFDRDRCDPLIGVPVFSAISPMPDAVMWILHDHEVSAHTGRNELEAAAHRYGEIAASILHIIQLDEKEPVRSGHVASADAD